MIYLCGLVGVVAARRLVIANSFAEIALVMGLCFERNCETAKKASGVFSTPESPSIWKVITEVDEIRIQIEKKIL